ncbi:glutathione S-transferase family protein [Cognatilysobacter tabacisoli]|uniref:glutathione S-transferase family protein n=1 Tax=Cognatilysobacter tabacisoli TaxID=2315424 RepID=UPI000E6B1589|nr:glutathione S-transferase family protein [Lysobacter tabacisoli]
MHTLYYAPGAASLLVHWLLIELDVPHALHKVDTAAREQKSAAYLALNPNGVVPTLVVDGQPRFEAAALAMMLTESHPDAGLAPAVDDPRRGEFLQWMFHLANVVQPLFRIWWYPGEAAGDAQADAAREHVRPRIEAAWDRLDAHLAAHGPHLLGERLSGADFYLVMLMRWSRGMPKPAHEWTHLGALAQRLKARPSFKTLYEREGLTEWA